MFGHDSLINATLFTTFSGNDDKLVELSRAAEVAGFSAERTPAAAGVAQLYGVRLLGNTAKGQLALSVYYPFDVGLLAADTGVSTFAAAIGATVQEVESIIQEAWKAIATVPVEAAPPPPRLFSNI
jgi:hypothetical protein